jgi:hypothetical protein
MKKKEIPEQALERARKALENTKWMLDVFKDAPEPVCNICGRVIYCGVNSLCSREPCGLKK